MATTTTGAALPATTGTAAAAAAAPTGIGPTRTAVDRQRSRVYAAEEAFGQHLEAARRGARQLSVAGSTLVLPEELLFGTLADVEAYAHRVLGAHPVPPVGVRVRRGRQRAHWESPGTVALPGATHGQPWAWREAVVLHELAHHLAVHLDSEGGHGPAFPRRLLDLVDARLGPQAAFLLQVLYAERGVRVGARP